MRESRPSNNGSWRNRCSLWPWPARLQCYICIIFRCLYFAVAKSVMAVAVGIAVGSMNIYNPFRRFEKALLYILLVN